MNKLLRLYKKLFFSDKWNIGFVYQTPGHLIDSKKLNGAITWLPEDEADYAADPFAISIKGRIHIFYEELNLWKGKGELMMLDELGFKNKKKVSGICPGSIHLSYPYLFKVKEELYCVPETSAAGQVALYRICQQDPSKLQKLRVILKGSAFVDSSIIYYQQRYWLFTSISGKRGQLYIYFSDTIEGTFIAHKQNPIAVEHKVSRSAGKLFVVGQKLYMPSQNPEKCYGGSIVINEITRICENHFQYQTAFELLPQEPYNRGLHTISFADGMVVVDGKRTVFSMLNPVKKLVNKLRYYANAS